MSSRSKQILNKIIEVFKARGLINEEIMEQEFGRKSFDEVAEEIDMVIGSTYGITIEYNNEGPEFEDQKIDDFSNFEKADRFYRVLKKVIDDVNIPANVIMWSKGIIKQYPQKELD